MPDFFEVQFKHIVGAQIMRVFYADHSPDNQRAQEHTTYLLTQALVREPASRSARQSGEADEF